MKRFLLIDANSLIHRAYHALPPLTSPSGEPTGAVYGFSAMLLKALRELKPDYAAAAFDLKGPTFRHETYKEYKATRPPTPENLAIQLEKSKEVLKALKIPVLGVTGFEADDIIGTLTNALKDQPDLEIFILSGDLDTLQLATDRAKILIPKNGIKNAASYDRQAVIARYGFPPELLVDYKALRGDPSDNIPGVKGIGEKTAALLVAKFGSIENIYRALEEGRQDPPLNAAVRKKLLQGKNQAFLSKAIAAINTNCPININLESYQFEKGYRPELEKLFEALGFKTLLPRLKEI
jgi:DNA polymerase-1